MDNRKSTFALFFGNRGFFPATSIAAARQEMAETLGKWGHKVLMMDEHATRHGAVETVREGQVYANFLQQHRGEFDGVILSLPNFGDENGAVTALEEAGVPILIQAYPDDMDKMDPANRRDSFCGKLSIMDVFYQHGVKFTALAPHTVKPSSPRWRQNVDEFDRVCRVVRGIKGMTVGAIGARTTPFKTVRIDELALQRHGITVETMDLSDLFLRMRSIDPESAKYRARRDQMTGFSTWDSVPGSAFDNIVRLGVALSDISEELDLDAMAIRCWDEMQKQIGISPCVAMGALNEEGLAASCEVDLGNAIAMKALSLASYAPPACLDWNNNYEDEDDKCILFHCGPAPASLMLPGGRVTDHSILMSTVGEGRSYGCNQGRLAPTDFTFGSLMTEAGKIKMFLGEGAITSDPIPSEFFGVAGVAHIPGLQDVLLHMGREGHRHHVSITPGRFRSALQEALGHYLGFEISTPQTNGAH